MPRSIDSGSATDRLRRIEAVTDAALAHMDVERLLHALLERVREVLEADTATVLLLDNSGDHLVATASSGIEEEVRQGARIPVGEGFAGTIAATRQPLILQQVDETTVVNPVLWKKGIRSLAGVPLLGGGEVLGVLHVGMIDATPFTEQDVELLRLVAERVALATRNRLTNADQAAASALQRTLLPGKLPNIPGLEMAARYAPGEAGGVSGDWYDVFKLPSGWLCAAIGDVVGRGLDAAMVMSRMRTTTRAFALDASDPADVLCKLDRHMRHFEPQIMATIGYAMWEPSLGRLRLSLAGHLAPMLAAPGEPPRMLDVPVDPPVGAGAVPRQRRTSTVDIPPGATVLFYTDGLVERRHRNLDVDLGLLRDAMESGPVERLCSNVMLHLVGADPTDDDIAILAMRRKTADEQRELTLELDAVPEALADIRAALRRWLPTVGAAPDDVADLLVVIGEAGANVIEHAYGPLGGKFTVRLEAKGGEVYATISDNGKWRSPRGLHRGRGTQLMRQLSDDLRIEYGSDGTDVHVRRRLSDGGAR
ncbi:SpoIIE family protein phosphatase [Prauserella oleivorans]|uniref:SpoIIE family protein phosphatase n=1 Tax=Prauserella oleivorans TaxID=1478153 RepID=A0ABW5WBL9_9PSEU